ncbi:MAG: hypothetical protein AVDCRST_MAG12-1742, partial [uncultured Rubrobacteraceae bacterium]
ASSSGRTAWTTRSASTTTPGA